MYFAICLLNKTQREVKTMIVMREFTVSAITTDEEKAITTANKISKVCDKYSELNIDCCNIDRHNTFDAKSFLALVTALVCRKKTVLKFNVTGEQKEIDNFVKDIRKAVA